MTDRTISALLAIFYIDTHPVEGASFIDAFSPPKGNGYSYY